MIEIYTDGAARGNPGRGGYGVILKYKQQYKELSDGFRLTTNNRMELLACIIGLEAIKAQNIDITIFSDSKYVVDSVVKGWVFSWVKKNNFGGKKNQDLWLRFLKVYTNHQVKFIWIKGHNEHPENERCDLLATSAADGNNLKIDTYYENLSDTPKGLF
ncbi:MAG TPA: ribonuclease HI [Chitinophagales bacterium]|nr:ribonuclease HI [Chitinophagales bacterium]HMY42237.1 ribonuclease HI [Chitinophagales bacterium]HMZ93714.1 ribonuclease HI [Chitinophagales bacterium]HNC65334.1 ribonuclease HI [Chitinophagales bacterium]HNG08774.1 ribonuclease HI [Chitinophagales bacterium]